MKVATSIFVQSAKIEILIPHTEMFRFSCDGSQLCYPLTDIMFDLRVPRAVSPTP